MAGCLLPWAEIQLGSDFADVLIEGYCEFTVDVNRSQLRYEKDGHYAHQSYKEVYETAYASHDFMKYYHWGVYTTTFAWTHHLRIYQMYRDQFLSRIRGLAAPGRLLDLGAGSGVWHLLASRQLPGWEMTAVDISETSVRIAREMSGKLRPGSAIHWVCGDALTHQLAEPADAGISCFLMEHLETPSGLLENLSRNLKPKAFAFVTLALTAAEYDHIYEFKRESEPIAMAESAGFRVIETFSSAPDFVHAKKSYLPRSMAMLLQKRRNDIY